VGAKAFPRETVNLEAASAGDQVEDQDDDRYDDENVDQAAADVQGKSEEPHHDENYEDCPKHNDLSGGEGARKPGR